MKVYVAAPYQQAAFVRVIHDTIAPLGLTPTATWCVDARGPEDFSRFDPTMLRRFAAQNDRDLASSDVVLLYDPDGSGCETYAEGRFACTLGIPVVWCSRRGLSQWREGVVRASDLDDAIARLVVLARHHAEGVRGELLAAMARAA